MKNYSTLQRITDEPSGQSTHPMANTDLFKHLSPSRLVNQHNSTTSKYGGGFSRSYFSGSNNGIVLPSKLQAMPPVQSLEVQKKRIFPIKKILKNQQLLQQAVRKQQQLKKSIVVPS
mmetsp:Transcript_34088/g.52374  ORF Transcript_34088/g.52374 Transcript_34088/m.52374 type:complete len:117 (+) Transcript_34088:170-520(+)